MYYLISVSFKFVVNCDIDIKPFLLEQDEVFCAPTV